MSSAPLICTLVLTISKTLEMAAATAPAMAEHVAYKVNVNSFGAALGKDGDCC